MRFARPFVAILLAVAAGGAEAQVSRVFVSVTGNDANVCSNIATPCRTFAGGITQVDPQGEVIVIASGSYAGGTITKSVKINVAAGIVAFSGLPITVNPGAGGTVVIRGLTLKAATAGTGTGIYHQTGTLFVENTVIDGWVYGLDVSGVAEQLFVAQSVVRNCNLGIYFGTGSPVAYTIDGSVFENNAASGLRIRGGTGRVSDTVLTGNAAAGADASGSEAVANFQRCEISSNGNVGIQAASGATVRVSQSTIVRNGIGLQNLADAATVESFGNNVIKGNVGGNNTDGTITTVVLK
jgi:hypothetical protein